MLYRSLPDPTWSHPFCDTFSFWVGGDIKTTGEVHYQYMDICWRNGLHFSHLFPQVHRPQAEGCPSLHASIICIHAYMDKCCFFVQFLRFVSHHLWHTVLWYTTSETPSSNTPPLIHLRPLPRPSGPCARTGWPTWAQGSHTAVTGPPRPDWLTHMGTMKN